MTRPAAPTRPAVIWEGRTPSDHAGVPIDSSLTPMDRYQTLVESSPAGIVVVSDGRIAYANAAAVRLFLDDGSDLRGRDILELVVPETRQDLGERLRRWGTGECQPAFEAPIAGRQSGPRYLSLRGARIEEHSGPAVQILVVDITDRVERERALRHSEEQLNLAVAGSQAGVWDWNLETNGVTYSERWKEMLGYSGDEIEPHVSAWERLVHPDDRARADRANDSVASGERATYEAEFRLRHKAGHYVHVLSRGYPVRRQPDGPVVRIVGTHLDLTEQKRAEAALRENEERLKLAFAGAQEGIYDWNLETGAVIYSPRWREMLGYGEDEIEPHVGAWERLLHPDDVAPARRAQESVERGAALYEGEFRLRHRDGHYVHVLSRGFPVRREPGGPVVRIVGTHFDLTARRQAEHERARTEFLTRLVFAQEDERRRIAREMHDQFGEQLTSLAQRIHSLKHATAADVALRGHVDALETIAQQLDRDVEQLVWELRPTALDDLGLRAALTNYVRNWSTRTGVAASVHMSGLLDERLPPHTETALYRIAQEALTNVAKHAGATNVEVMLERRGDHVLLIVEDNGVGFDSATAEQAGGGFGLTGMKERAALIGATLEIESSTSGGTTVLVRIDVTLSTTSPDHV
jgi:PAS domain S-box-containing protein